MRNQAVEGNAMYFPYPGENMQDSLRRTHGAKWENISIQNKPRKRKTIVSSI